MKNTARHSFPNKPFDWTKKNASAVATVFTARTSANLPPVFISFLAGHFDDPNFEQRAYDPWLAYGQSKTANVLFAVEFDRRGQRENVRAFSLHPGGIVNTGLAKHMTREQIRQAGGLDEHGNPVVDPAKGLKSVEQGASTIVWC